MRLMTYNILEGGVGRIDPLAEVIRLAGAEVVVLQETWDAANFHKLADRLGMDRFLADNPKNPKGATGLLTRLPLREAVNHAPLDSRLTRSAFHALVEIEPGRKIPIVGLHLHARETMEDERIRLSELPAIFDIAAGLPRPHMMAGDFNTSHPEQQIDLAKLRPKSRERIRGQGDQLPREVIGQVLARGYVDAHAIHHAPVEGDGKKAFDTSFTTAHPAMRVDFIFVTPELAGRVESCEVFKPEMARFASDHYPVLAEIAV